MALRNVVKDGDPILKKVCRPVTSFDERLAQLLDDMGETLIEANGLGLAGPQVGVMRRVFVALDESDLPEEPPEGWQEGEEFDWEPKIVEFINPEILEEEGEVRAYEGCLSFPGRYGAIKRPERVKVRAVDRNGEPFELEADWYFARCICHETNHLDGVTIDDLAEYFYDPNTPHDLDASIEPEDAEEADAEIAALETEQSGE